ncbi:MAG: uroporphyrinogen decarboxylase [Lentisphaeria bacterium]|nr:uroporphyrinogen decarboxylase [Lentisphaeria bacterium]
MSRADRFLNACHMQSVDATPIWLMRQAGRYMQEYRDLRSKYKILELIKDPDIATEVTMQPVNAFNVDAAIIFSDILPLLEGMGIDLEFISGKGPVIHNPVKTHADIEALAQPNPEESMDFTIEAIRRTVKTLDGKIPLIGFSGAPFTLASYAIEGGPSKEYLGVKKLMHGSPDYWHKLMEKISKQISHYLIAQVGAGAQALQLFDSWIGCLSPFDYREYIQPHVAQIIRTVKTNCRNTPLIYFGTGNAGFLDLFKETNPDIIGVDWRMDLLQAWDIVGHDTPVQGNLDPALLLAPKDVLKAQAARLIDSVKGRKGHIFNLGHGIFKYTDPGHVRELIDFVHEYSSQGND